MYIYNIDQYRFVSTLQLSIIYKPPSPPKMAWLHPSAKKKLPSVEGGGDPKDASEMLNDPEMMKAQGIPAEVLPTETIVI